ncbi:MAG: hypothetical protein ABFS10_08370 [Bacteroidota bacterium]
MRTTINLLIILSLVVSTVGCDQGNSGKTKSSSKDQPKIVKKRRDDGTLSSAGQVDAEGYLHGIKVNYYEDGKTVHSKVTYEHGRKQGAALWYYKNGQVHEHTNFHYGRKQGLTKKYYDTGQLMEELTYEQGEELPGKKSYNRSGELISH